VGRCSIVLVVVALAVPVVADEVRDHETSTSNVRQVHFHTSCAPQVQKPLSAEWRCCILSHSRRRSDFRQVARWMIRSVRLAHWASEESLAMGCARCCHHASEAGMRLSSQVPAAFDQREKE